MAHRAIIFLPIVAIYLLGFFHFANWQMLPARGDDTGYYIHVVSFWINGDVGDYGRTTADLLEAHPEARALVDDPYLIKPTKKGRKVIKYTIGAGLMETPFFLVAHLYGSLSSAYPTNGWGTPYYFMVCLGNLLFVLSGLWMLMRLLELHFSRQAVAMTLVGIALATNLFFHATYVTMAHGFLFFDFCLLLWLSMRIYRKPRPREAFFIGLVCALIAVTRVPEVICVLVPILWGVTSWQGFRGRIVFLRNNIQLLLWAAAGFLPLAALQCGYWYFVSGHLFFNPYQGEGFDFLKPEIWLGWFDFANGWLIYTPIMFFSLGGLFLLRRYFPDILIPLLLFIVLHVWIHYSYYAWTYYPGLGQRPMVESYPLLAFGMAACFQFLWSAKGVFRWIPLLALGFFSALNLFQTWQMGQGIILTERGNPAFYLETFGAVRRSRHALLAYDTGILQPDTADLAKTGTLARERVEDNARFSAFPSSMVEGKRAFLLPSGHDTIALTPAIPVDELPQRSWLRASIGAYVAPEHKIWNRDNCADLVLEFRDATGRIVRKKWIKISSYVGNAAYSLWDTGTPGQWGEAAFFVRLPRKGGQGWTINACIVNPGGQQLFLDDFRMEVFSSN